MEQLIRDWAALLRAAGRSPKTIETYIESARAFVTWLATSEKGFELEAADLRRRHVEGFMAWLLDNRAVSTASVRFRALQQWFKWLVEEEEIAANPMLKMTAPRVPDKPVPVKTDDEIRKSWPPARARATRTAGTTPSSGSTSTPA